MKPVQVEKVGASPVWYEIAVTGDPPAFEELAASCRCGEPRDRKQLVEAGTQLWHTLFSPALERDFASAVLQAKERSATVRLLLDLPAGGRDLDWEALFDPAAERFLVKDDGIEIYRSATEVGLARRPVMESPLRVVIAVLGGDATTRKELEEWIGEALAALAEIGTASPQFLGPDPEGSGPAASLYHLFVLDPRELTSAAGRRSSTWCRRKEHDAPGVLPRLRRRLSEDAVGVISFVGDANDDGARLLAALHRQGWPLFLRLDLCHRDLQDHLALRDLYFALGSDPGTVPRLAWVQARQLDLDDRTAARRRIVQLFAITREPLFPLPQMARRETRLQHFLRTEIASQERFYQWEKMYAELTFSTRLRLRQIDLSALSDLREIPDRTFHLREALAEFDFLVVIGEPGTGKTTACRRASWELAKEAYQAASAETPEPGLRIPLYVELKTLSEGSLGRRRSLLDALAAGLPLPDEPEQSLELRLERFLGGAKLVALLDGLNEISPPSHRRHILEEILYLRQRFTRRLSLLVTSRKHDFEVGRFAASGFQILEILELSPSDIRKFAACSLPDAESVERFENGLSRSLRSAARNPLMLRLLLEDFKRNRSLIGSRAQLLRRFCQSALEEPAAVLPGSTKQQVAVKEGILTDIAYALWSQSFRLRARLQECKALALASAGDEARAEAVLREMAANGILSIDVDDQGQEVVDFRFQSYHEYFCARRVAALWLDGSRSDLARLARQEGWHEIIALAAGVIEIERRAEKPAGDLIDFLQRRRQILLAGMCVWNMEKNNEELKPFERWLVARAQASADVLTRIAGVMLFYLLFPLWGLTLAAGVIWAADSEIYLLQFRQFRLGTAALAALVFYLAAPVLFYRLYLRLSRWIERKQETLVLRPTLAALYLIGSEFARGSIVSLFESALAPTLEEAMIGTDEKHTFQAAARSLEPFRQEYHPDLVLELVRERASLDDIRMVARVTAKEASGGLLQQLGNLTRSSDPAVATRAREAGKTLVWYNRELYPEWQVMVPSASRIEPPAEVRPSLALRLSALILEPFLAASLGQKIIVIIALGCTVWSVVSGQWQWLGGVVLSAILREFAARLLKARKGTVHHIGAGPDRA